jgi:F-type H+-transporting ATPase subunit alpha
MVKKEKENLSKTTEEVLDKAISKSHNKLVKKEIGYVTEVTDSVISAMGLENVGSEEAVLIKGRYVGMVLSINKNNAKIALLDKTINITVGDEVIRTNAPVSTPVGEELIGRVLDPLGRVLDGEKPLSEHSNKFPVERPARGIIERHPVTVPLETGIKVIDALIPIGRGQRELILGDRQTGKTAVALDTIVHQKGKGVICIYCAVGQRDSSIANTIEELRTHGALDYTIIVKSSGSDAPGLQYITPYAATSMGEYFMEKGKDVLIIYDDLTRHARAYRELALLLERSPGREAFPGDIFYIHSRLLERSTRLKKEHGGGSLTALPIVETEAENISAYIPTNVISITDGQIYLSPVNFQKGLLPAIHIGKSVSRVGGEAQVKAYKSVAGTLGISYSQFEELEMFSRFATKLDDDTKKIINRGQKVRAILKQGRYETIPTEEQIAIFLSVTSGTLDEIEDSEFEAAEKTVRETMSKDFKPLAKSIRAGEKLTDEVSEEFLNAVKKKLGIK